MRTTKKKVIATAFIWLACVLLLLFGGPLFGPKPTVWGWIASIVAMIIIAVIWRKGGGAQSPQ